MNALPSLTPAARRSVLHDHVLPALSRAGLVRPDTSPAEPCDNDASVRTCQGSGGGQEGGAGGGGGGGSGRRGMVVAVHSCVQMVLEGGWNPVHRGSWEEAARGAGSRGSRGSARERIRLMFVHAVALLECFLLYSYLGAELPCVTPGDASSRGHGAGANSGYRGAPTAQTAEAEALEGLEACLEACSWKVEMPSDLHMDLSAMDVSSLDDVHGAVRVGWACYLNFATAVVSCVFTSSVPTAEEDLRLAPTVLGRLVQGMQCRQHLLDVVLPFLARCLKGPTTRAGVVAKTEAAGDGAAARGQRSREEEAQAGPASVGGLPGSLLSAALALQDVCACGWEVEVPSRLLCESIVALEPRGLATQKANCFNSLPVSAVLSTLQSFSMWLLRGTPAHVRNTLRR